LGDFLTEITMTDSRTDTSNNADDVRKNAYRLLQEGVRLLNAGRYGEAIEVLKQANDLLPDDPDIMITLGGAMILAGKWNAAESFLEKAVEKHPENARLWLNLAAATLGRLELSPRWRQDKAIAAYQRAIELDPTAPSAHYNVGLIHAERKDWEQAIHWFEAAVRANPLDKDARLWLKRAQEAYEDSQREDSNAEESTS
jgi:tetratricopeptide (TPR) repeat protein